MDTTYKISIGPALKEKIPPGSPYWQTFNGSFANREVKSPELAQAIFDGHAFTTWHNNNWRNRANYAAGQHLGIDFDTCDYRSQVDTLLGDPFVSKYAAVAYTTPSHKIEKPRARVVFLLDAPIMQAANYALAAAAMLWIFGAADRQCKDCCRFFYGHNREAPDGRIEWLPNVLPLDKVKEIIKRYQVTGHQQRHDMHRYEATTTDEKQVQDALKHIPPWNIEYDEWLAVLMAIHSEFPGANGLAMAESWAQGYTGEVQQKWRSFKPTGNESGRVGLGTLVKMAKDNGYTRPS